MNQTNKITKWNNEIFDLQIPIFSIIVSHLSIILIILFLLAVDLN